MALITQYNLTTEEDTLIRGTFTSHKDWGNARYKKIKTNIKDHLMKQQKKRCSYCNMKINTGNTFVHIEHLVPKEKHEQFTFNTNNLVLACQACNTKKSTTETLSNPSTTSYPQKSDDFLIFHPMLDKYSDHLSLVDGIFIVSISPKGERTVKICKLDRLELAIQNVENSFTDSTDVGQKLMRILLNHPEPRIQKQIHKRIDYILNNLTKLCFD